MTRVRINGRHPEDPIWKFTNIISKYSRITADDRQFCRRTQEVLSQTASNYNLTRLLLGIVAAIDSLVLALIASRRDLLRPKSAATLFGLFSALYLIMMFASSYVEEEQHFWYWITSPWICYVLLFASRDGVSSLPGRGGCSISFIASALTPICEKLVCCLCLI